MNRTVLIGLLCGAIVASTGLVVAASKQTPVRMEVQVPVTINYLLYLPPGYEHKDKWPLLLFLHGAGERGSDLEKVKKHGPPKLIEEGNEFPFIVVSPQC